MDFVLIESNLLQEIIVLLLNRRKLKEIQERFPGKVIYFPQEIERLWEFKDDKELVKKTHLVKKKMEGWIVP